MHGTSGEQTGVKNVVVKSVNGASRAANQGTETTQKKKKGSKVYSNEDLPEASLGRKNGDSSGRGGIS